MAEPISQEKGDMSSGKSPGKSRKNILGSLFKRSGTDELRSSNKDRASSRSKKKKNDTADTNHEAQTRLTVSMDTGKNEGEEELSSMQFKTFEEDSQELEQKSVSDLSSKKAQRRNKELSKQNTQLTKSVDALKKQREELLSDKQKLKSENKTLERELKRVSSKGEVRIHKKSSQMSIESEHIDQELEELKLKVQMLEARLAERDIKLKKIRDRLQRVNAEMPDLGLPPLSTSSSRRESEVAPPVISQNGDIINASTVERISEEQNGSSSLQIENAELRAKVATLQFDLAHMQSTMGAREAGDTKSRKKSGNFFRRGKAHSKSMMIIKHSDAVSREREAVSDIHRSKSPDFLSASDSYHDIEADISALTGSDPRAVTSLPNFIYAGLSPRSAAKRAHGDMQTLQSCLKAAIDEKKSLSEKNKQLEADLAIVKDKIKDQSKFAEEKEQALQMLESMRDTLVTEKKELNNQIIVLKKTNETLNTERSLFEQKHLSTIAQKDSEILILKENVKKLQETIESMRKESEDVFVPPTSQQTPKQEAKAAKIVSTKPPAVPISQSKPPAVPVSQSKPSGKSSEPEKTRKTSQTRTRRRSSSSSLSSDEHFDSVANTRAMFEQKIVSFRGDSQSPKHSSRKSSWNSERRGSYSNASPGLKPIVGHAKSSSFDTSIISVNENTSQKSPILPLATATEIKKSDAKQNGDISKPINLKPNATVVKSFTSTNKEITTISKVSKIIVKSTASPTGSPVLSRQKTVETSSNSSSFLAKQTSLPVTTAQTFSTSRTAGGALPRSTSVDYKTGTSPVAKRTIVQPVRSNSVTITTSANTTSTSAKVTISDTNTDTVKLRNGSGSTQRPKSVLLPPPSTSIFKASSLQNIPEQTSSKSIFEPPNPPPPTPTDSVITNKSPVPRRFQRRDRSERPKTMYAGKAETANLVNLISRFQQQEAAKKQIGNSSSQSPVTTSAKVLGNTNKVPTPTHTVTSGSTRVNSARSSSPPAVVMRNNVSRAPRPKTFYGHPNEKIVKVRPPSSPMTNRKPPPSERPLLRAQTVGTGLGLNRQSKKAMLLRWCQRETVNYDNVHIQNFDSSFSDGMAFCALMHNFLPDKIPYNSLSPKNRQHNFTVAFNVAEEAGIPSLLDVEDMVDLPIPDWMSVMTYVSFIYNKFGQPNNNST